MKHCLRRYPVTSRESYWLVLRKILLFNDELGVFPCFISTFWHHARTGDWGDNKRALRLSQPRKKLSTAMFSPRIRRGLFTRVLLTGGPHEEKDDNPSSLFCTLFNV
uniref:Uncharacterized protein n=1 Tax=Klebsiella pneumoniae TaxID=573 RepID=A0A8B0SW73_KLEPN|nr:hypothetical protein [Klebsiella pneumoniae]